MDQDPGLTGNLLVERLVGAHIELISKEEYAKIGSVVCLLLFLFFTFLFYLTDCEESILIAYGK